jgi:hypothetical protein
MKMLNLFFLTLSFVLPPTMKEEVIGDLYELSYNLEKQGKSALKTNLIVVIFGLKIALAFIADFFLESTETLIQLLSTWADFELHKVYKKAKQKVKRLWLRRESDPASELFGNVKGYSGGANCVVDSNSMMLLFLSVVLVSFLMMRLYFASYQLEFRKF